MASSKPRAAIVHGQPVGPEKLQFAKLLRRTMTRPERLLWNALRRSQLNGLHFRRQQIAGDLVLDFYCDAARLAMNWTGLLTISTASATRRAMPNLREWESRSFELPMTIL
jgi:very-short-patch-repair endonuclease